MPPKNLRKATKRKSDVTSTRKSIPKTNNDYTIHKMIEIFKESQTHAGSHDRLSVQLKSIYKSLPFDAFWEDFLELTRYPMVEKEQSSNIDNVMSFIVNFALFLCRGDEDGASVENSDQDSAILLKLLEFCCENHDAAKPTVRYRCVQFMRKILAGLGHEATVSDQLFFTIQERLLTRAWDVKANIRSESAHALSRMQDPVNRDCPIIITLLHMLQHDSNVEVRKAALISIAITTKTLPAIIERCQDIADVVRKKAYSILKSKSLLKPLSIAKRLRLLQDGLNDPSQSVKEECIAMLQRWFELCNKDPLLLLKRFDVEGSRDITEQAIKVLLASQTTEQILQSVSGILNEELVLKEEFYTQEAAFYWRVVCFHLRSNSDEGPQIMDKVLPLGKVYADFLKKIMNQQRSLSTGDSDFYMEHECMCSNVMELASCVDLSDEFGRKSLVDMTRRLLIAPNCPVTSIEPLIKLYSVLEPDQYRMCDIVVELVSEIRDPHSMAEKLASQTSESIGEEKNSESAISESNSRRMMSQLEEISSKINDLDDLIKHAPENYDLEDLKKQRVELENEKSQLSTSISCSNVTAPEEKKIESIVENSENAVLTDNELNDYNILIRCTVMTVKVLQTCKKVWKLTSCLRSLMDSLIIPSVQSVHPGVRNHAVKALGLLSILNGSVAVKYMPLFMQIVELDNDKIRVSALSAIIDSFLVFGMEPFKNNNPNECQNEGQTTKEESDDDADMFTAKSTQQGGGSSTSQVNSDGDDTLVEDHHLQETENDQALWATNLMSIFITRLDSPSVEVRTLCGKALCKLLLYGRIASPKLLSRLILLWFNPITEDNVSLLHFLSNFLNVYCSSSLENQQSTCQAVLPTLKTLFKAPASSPLTEVDPWNVAYFLLTLTDSVHLRDNAKSANNAEEKRNNNLENPVHDDLALILANEIMNAPSASGVRIYVRMLCNIRLSPNNSRVVKDLLIILHPMIKKIGNRALKNMLERLQKDLKEILTKMGLTLTPSRIPFTPKPNNKKTEKVSALSKSFLGDLEEPTLIMEENSGSDLENSGAEATLKNKKVSFLNATYLSQRFKQSLSIAQNMDDNESPNRITNRTVLDGLPESDDITDNTIVGEEEEESPDEEEVASQPESEKSQSSSQEAFKKPPLKRNFSTSNAATTASKNNRVNKSLDKPKSAPNVRRTFNTVRLSTTESRDDDEDFERPTTSTSYRSRSSKSVNVATTTPSAPANVRKSSRSTTVQKKSVVLSVNNSDTSDEEDIFEKPTTTSRSNRSIKSKRPTPETTSTHSNVRKSGRSSLRSDRLVVPVESDEEDESNDVEDLDKPTSTTANRSSRKGKSLVNETSRAPPNVRKSCEASLQTGVNNSSRRSSLRKSTSNN